MRKFCTPTELRSFYFAFLMIILHDKNLNKKNIYEKTQKFFFSAAVRARKKDLKKRKNGQKKQFFINFIRMMHFFLPFLNARTAAEKFATKKNLIL